MRFLRACGLPAGGVHSGNVMLFKADPALAAEGSLLLEQPAAHARISEWEQALLGASPYSTLLARPRTDAPFAVGWDVLAFGHLLYEMITGCELTERQLAAWSKASPAGNPRDGGWALLERIFLPTAESRKAPSLLDIIAGADAPPAHALHPPLPLTPPRRLRSVLLGRASRRRRVAAADAAALLAGEGDAQGRAPTLRRGARPECRAARLVAQRGSRGRARERA
jgi:hypothetical protein